MKIVNKLSILFLFFSLAFLVACDPEDDSSSSDVVLPTNLVITLEEDMSIRGLVNVSATANNTNYYSFIFTDNTGSTTKESTNGEESYQYRDTGTYTIIVRAHLTAGQYIESTKSIYIDLGLTPPPPVGSGPPTTGFVTPLTYPNYTLVWNDEFDGTELNTADWNYEIGTGNNGWGNNELQYYRQENTSVSNGILTIEAKDDFFNGRNYTSSRITTQNKQSFKYGRIDIRAAMPYGQGIWPALWMLGDDFSTAGWPFCGEIDIMEMVGGITTSDRGDGVTHGTAHWSDGSYASLNGNTRLSSGRLADEFHVYSIVWDSQKIDWYLDDVKFHSLDITPSGLSEFNQKFFFIFNVAVGGNWPGSPNSSTVFSQNMYVDYVRVFQ